MTSHLYQQLRHQYDTSMAPTYDPYPFVPVRGAGSFLYGDDGREYVDWGGGIAVNALGHCHPEIVKALSEQAGKLWHLSNNFMTTPPLELAEKLINATFAERVFFVNSGTEANETALKMARRYCSKISADKNEVVAFHGGFHGRSLFTVTVGGKDKYKEGFGPLPTGIRHEEFNDVEALRRAVGERTCAVILEPVQGENGIIPATKVFLEEARRLCSQFGAVLIFDEIQSGVGRCGTLYAYQHYGVTPDILTTAKALGAGFPISATLTTTKIASAFQPGLHGSTFGGNPLACAVAGRALELIDTEVIRKNTAKQSQALFSGIRAILSKCPIADEPRGLGLLIGIPLKADYAGRIKELCHIATSLGLIILQSGTGVVRLAPALNITDDAVAKGLDRLGQSFEELRRRPA